MMLLLLTLLTAQAGTVRASSNLKNDDGLHSAAQAVDGSFRTAWAESASGSAKGEWLELDLGRSTALTNVAIWPGNLKTGSRSYREYGRPRTIRVVVDGKPQGNPIVLPDRMQRTVIPLNVTGRKVKIAVDDTFEGIVFNDTYIAEIAVNFPNGALRGWDSWLAGSDAKRRHAQFIKELEAAYVKQKETEFGDKAAFQFLSDAVAEGPGYIRSRLTSLVPVGYRAQAIPISGQAHKALRNLKDANAIPAFEMAALRETGDSEQDLNEVVQLLRAYQEMIGTANNNVPYWGETGWGLGALRSFGEPIAMDMDADGNIYVADTGNNRIQRFTIDGQGERQWGPGADLANEWFGGARDWYVSGAKPGSKIGEFINPLDVTVIPTKEGDGFAALDASGRVQVFDPKGRPVVSWQLSTTSRPSPKLGGEGYLAYIPKKALLVAILQDEGRVHSLDSAEVAAWKIADGPPRSVEVSANGQLLFGYGDRIVQYNPDGFRFGTVVTSDQLGRGHEDFDMAIDEKKRLWVLTDAGQVVKFKRPGVVEFAVHAVDRPLKHPRIEVRDGIVFYCSDDRIEQVDVLQARLDAEGAEGAE